MSLRSILISLQGALELSIFLGLCHKDLSVKTSACLSLPSRGFSLPKIMDVLSRVPYGLNKTGISGQLYPDKLLSIRAGPLELCINLIKGCNSVVPLATLSSISISFN